MVTQKMKRICKECNKDFYVTPSKVKYGNGITFCSWKCFQKQPTKYWLGKKRSQETNNKISMANKGHIAWNKGNHTKNNDALIMWREKGGAIKGEDHYRWNPDREAMERNERNDPEYKQWVVRVKRRDKECQLKDDNCKGYMIAAHIKSWALYPEDRYKVNNGITLCQGHHPKTRDEDQRLMPVFQELVGSRN